MLHVVDDGGCLTGAMVPILTWSSWFADVGMLSTLAGCAEPCSRIQSCGSVLCNHESVVDAFLYTEEAGKSAELRVNKALNSALCNIGESAMAIPRVSIAMATGWPWKLPPEKMSPLSGKISGLSVTELISVSITLLTWSNARRLAP